MAEFKVEGSGFYAEITVEEHAHLVCPECGSRNILSPCAQWKAQSIDDPGNDAVLDEYQCADCSRSIWL